MVLLGQDHLALGRLVSALCFGQTNLPVGTTGPASAGPLFCLGAFGVVSGH
jgi:hypothetical protein